MAYPDDHKISDLVAKLPPGRRFAFGGLAGEGFSHYLSKECVVLFKCCAFLYWSSVAPVWSCNERGWFSFEYFPPKTAEGVENLRKRIVKMKEGRVGRFVLNPTTAPPCGTSQRPTVGE